jgi:hypothetical protein
VRVFEIYRDTDAFKAICKPAFREMQVMKALKLVLTTLIKLGAQSRL